MFIFQLNMDITTKFGILIQFGLLLFARSEYFEFGDKGTACILLDIDASFNLTYNDGSTFEEAEIFDLTGATVVNSSSLCSDSVFVNNSILMVSLFPSGEHVEFSFRRQFGDIMMHVRLFLRPSQHFTNINNTFPIEMKDYSGLNVGEVASSNYSFECHTKQELHFLFDAPFHMTMTISDIQAQAYSITDGTFGPAKECKQDLSTTTEPGPITTTVEPESSTGHTNTTESPMETSTVPNVETTTNPWSTIEPESSTAHTQTSEPPIETSTGPIVDTTTIPHTASSITTVPMTTKPSPATPKYIVKDNGIVCIVIEGFISFDIPYQKKDNTTAVASNITLPNKVNVEGNCHVNGSAQDITIKFFEAPWVLDIIIMTDAGIGTGKKLEGGSDTYTWSNMKLSYTVDKHFTDAKHTGSSQSAEAYGAFDSLKVDNGGSFKCHAIEDFSLNKGVHVKLNEIQYRAFGKTGSSDFTKNGVMECAADRHGKGGGGNDSKLGIILGLVFGGLAVVVLVIGVVRYCRKQRKNSNPDRLLNYS